jgi:hypothetical protein
MTDIIDNVYDRLNLNIVDGIKIYTGTTNFTKEKIDTSISYFQDLSSLNEKIFTELVPSTLTAKGSFSNICFNEEDIIDMLAEPVGGYILKICCNYGVIINQTPNYEMPPVKVRVSNRGRKPKIKKISKRKLQGSGKYFSSQITFEIYNPESKKIYKIKLFRNGGFQVPGISKPDITDLIMPIKTLRTYLQEEFVDDDIEVQYFISVMRNYICRLFDSNLLIRLNELETLFKTQKDNDENNPLYDLMDGVSENLKLLKNDKIKEYIGKKYNYIGIAEIQNNCERYFGLILKFYRPVSWKIDKRTTIKVLRSGKINIDGSNSIEEAHELYYWLEYIFNEYKNSILFNKMAPADNLSDYDIGSGESLYDEDEVANV